MSIEERFEEARNFFNNDEYDKAVPLLETLANEGHAVAQYMLGICYFSGKGIAKDNAKAIEWLQKSAEQEYEKAKKMLSEIKAESRGCTGSGCLGAYLTWLNFGGKIGAIYGIILSFFSFLALLFENSPAGNIIFIAPVIFLTVSVIGHFIWWIEVRLKVRKSRGGKIGAIIGVGITILMLVIGTLSEEQSLTKIPTMIFGFLVLAVFVGIILSVLGYAIELLVKWFKNRKLSKE